MKIEIRNSKNTTLAIVDFRDGFRLFKHDEYDSLSKTEREYITSVLYVESIEFLSTEDAEIYRHEFKEMFWQQFKEMFDIPEPGVAISTTIADGYQIAIDTTDSGSHIFTSCASLLISDKSIPLTNVTKVNQTKKHVNITEYISDVEYSPVVTAANILKKHFLNRVDRRIGLCNISDETMRGIIKCHDSIMFNNRSEYSTDKSASVADDHTTSMIDHQTEPDEMYTCIISEDIIVGPVDRTIVRVCNNNTAITYSTKEFTSLVFHTLVDTIPNKRILVFMRTRGDSRDYYVLNGGAITKETCLKKVLDLIGAPAEMSEAVKDRFGLDNMYNVCRHIADANNREV